MSEGPGVKHPPYIIEKKKKPPKKTDVVKKNLKKQNPGTVFII